MRPRIATLCVLGAALTLAATAAAQDTTKAKPKARSTTRIPIQKESPGEVVTPRVDTVTVYRTDTLNVYRTDTVRTSMTLHDTVRVEVPLMPAPVRHIGGLYFGIAGGSALPAASINDAEGIGPRIEGMLGYDPAEFPVGLRLNAGYDTHSPRDYYSPLTNGSRAQLWDVSGDPKLRSPAAIPWGLHINMYAVGGGTLNYWKNLIQPLNDGTGRAYVGNALGVPGMSTFTTTTGTTGTYGGTTGTTTTTYDNAWYHAWGWNAGGGAEVGWRALNVFAEARYQLYNSWVRVANVPIVLGVTLF